MKYWVFALLCCLAIVIFGTAAGVMFSSGLWGPGLLYAGGAIWISGIWWMEST